MSDFEQRPGVGIRVTSFPPGIKEVSVDFWALRGSGYVALEHLTTPKGRVTVGTSRPVMGARGPEILWGMPFIKRHDALEILSGYIAANGWQGTPEELARATAMLQ